MTICDTPTPVQFTRAFRKLFFSSLLTSSSGNCAEDLDVLLAEFSNTTTGATPDATPLVTPTPQPPTLTIGPTDYREQNVNSNIIKENAIAYVSGYLLNKCFKIHSCSKCTETLASNDLDDNRKLLCYFKAYSQENGNFGGLHAPTACYLQYVIQLEDIFIKHFSIFTKSACVGANILKLLKCAPVPFQCCPEFPLDFLQKLFLRMRIYYSLKFANRDLSSTARKNKKYIKVAHL